MKKFCMLLVLALSCALGSKAENMAVGFQFMAGTDVPQFGLNAKLQIGIINHLRVEPEIVWLIKNKGTTTWNIGANVHYVFNIGKFNAYPIVGVGYGRYIHTAKDGWSLANNRCYFNIGAGGEYNIADGLFATLEIRGNLTKNYSQALFGLGLKYAF